MRGILTPLALLAALLALSLWNGRRITADTARWQTQLEQADALAGAEDWAGATAALAEGYRDWSRRQTYLHVVSQHSAVDEAEVLYRRCQAYAAAREPSELRAEVAALVERLRLLAEMERFSVQNVL